MTNKVEFYAAEMERASARLVALEGAIAQCRRDLVQVRSVARRYRAYLEWLSADFEVDTNADNLLQKIPQFLQLNPIELEEQK